MFDYVNDQSEEVGNFVPNTDLTYGEMKRVVLEEWSNRSLTSGEMKTVLVEESSSVYEGRQR